MYVSAKKNDLMLAFLHVQNFILITFWVNIIIVQLDVLKHTKTRHGRACGFRASSNTHVAEERV